MPTYDYQCATCGKRFEHFQSITSSPLTRCTAKICVRDDGEAKGEGELRRLVSGGAGLVFKGEGFYLTDYARKEQKGGGKSEAGKGESGGSTGKGGSGGTSAAASGTSAAE